MNARTTSFLSCAFILRMTGMDSVPSSLEGRLICGRYLPLLGFLLGTWSWSWSSEGSLASSCTPNTSWEYHSHLLSTLSHPSNSFPSPISSLKSCLLVLVKVSIPNDRTYRPYIISPAASFQAAITTTLAPHCFHISFENSRANFRPFASAVLTTPE